MAKLEMQGMDEYLKKLEKVANPEGMIKRAVYDGAAVLAKAVLEGINSIPENDGKYVPNNAQITGLSAAQKQGLRDGLGIARMQNDKGFIHTKIGFDGYNSVKTKKYPNGQPNSLIARAVESGTSRRQKYRFVSKATTSAKAAAEQAMANRMDQDLKQTMEG